MRILAGLTALIALAFLGWAGAADAGPLKAMPAEVGSVETVGGPGFCSGGSVRNAESTKLRALVVGASGEVFVDTGGLATPRVAQIDIDVSNPEELGHSSSQHLALDLYDAPRLLGDADTNNRTASLFKLSPYGRVTSDGERGVYVSEGDRVVHINSSGGSSVTAGARQRKGASLRRTQSGDGGNAESAVFDGIRSLASDALGNIYVADAPAGQSSFRIRFVNTSNQVEVFYKGTPSEISVGAGKIETIAGFPDRSRRSSLPVHQMSLVSEKPVMEVEGDSLYFTSYLSKGGARAKSFSTVEWINLGASPFQRHGVDVAPGEKKVFAGGETGFFGDGGLGAAARFGVVTGIAAGANGDVLLADRDNNRIRKIDAVGGVSTFAGSGTPGVAEGGFNGNEQPARDALLNQPFDVKIGPLGKVFISDQNNHQLRFVDEAGVIHPALGNGVSLVWKCRGKSSKAPMGDSEPKGPISVAVDAKGRTYVANETGQIKTIVGDRTVAVGGTKVAPDDCKRRCSNGNGGLATKARFGRISAIASRPQGGVYVMDKIEPRIRFINTGNKNLRVHGVAIGPGRVQTVAGTGRVGNSGDGGQARKARFSANSRMVADALGNLLIADPDNSRVRKVDAKGRISTTIEGDPNGPANACCAGPSDVAVDRNGNLYISDSKSNRVWFRNIGKTNLIVHGQSVSAGALVPIAGSETPKHLENGDPALGGSLRVASNLAVDTAGNLYISGILDPIPTTGIILKVDRGGALTTISESQLSFNGDGLPSLLTWIKANDIATDPCGNLITAESGIERVRRLMLTRSCR